MPTYDNASGITCGCQQQQGTDLVKVWIAHWVCDEVAGRSTHPLPHVGGGGLVPDFTREAVHLEQMRELLYDEAPFKVRCSKTPLPATCLTHAARKRMFRRLMILCS